MLSSSFQQFTLFVQLKIRFLHHVQLIVSYISASDRASIQALMKRLSC
jgi:hypothetical protein